MRKPSRVRPSVGFNPRSIATVKASESDAQRRNGTPQLVPYTRNFNEATVPEQTPKRVPFGFTSTTRQIEIAR